MPKRKWYPEPLTDGFSNAVAFEAPEEKRRTPAEAERDSLIAEILADPAHVLIRDAITRAAGPDVDHRDPAFIRQAIAEGRALYADYESRGLLVATFASLRNSTRDNGQHAPVVYYMRMSGLVKIGTTTNIGKRMTQVGPQGVMALEPGGSAHEHERHNEFGHLHDHLEWFALAPDLMALISRLRADFEREMGRTTEAWIEPWLPRRKTKSRTHRDVVAI